MSAEPDFGLHEIAAGYDVRWITPRQMADLSFDLYFSGHLSREQYAELAFQSELMPNFNQTIGALTGKRAEPDRPRDYTEIWHQRLEFEMEHLPNDSRILERTRKIIDLLQSLKTLPEIYDVPEDVEEPAFPTFNLPPLSLRG
ncbi:MAG: hypothetical protein HQ503_14265 [Rhodospirillales bacterium]|nr:hypothetical protein [Rhodospirillales bacterium]